MSAAVAIETGRWSTWPAPGVYGDVPEDDYHDEPNGISVSRLKRFARLPALAHIPRKESRTLAFGSLIHSVILTPEAAEKHYVLDDRSRNANAFKADKAEHEAAGREVVYTKDWDEARYIRDAIMATQIGRDLLTPGTYVPEQSFWWRDWETGLLMRGRADIVKPQWRVLADIKSCEDASEAAFAKAVSDYAYDWQAIHYEDGFELAQAQSGQRFGHNGGPRLDLFDVAPRPWRPEEFIFLAVEKEPPYLCHPMALDPVDLEASRVELRETINRYKACMDAGLFPAYPDTLTRVRVSDWARKQRARIPAYHDPNYDPDVEIITP